LICFTLPIKSVFFPLRGKKISDTSDSGRAMDWMTLNPSEGQRAVHRQNQECPSWASRRLLSEDGNCPESVASHRFRRGLPRVLSAELAERTWLFVGPEETNRRIQFCR
jgi:hypothetical protein